MPERKQPLKVIVIDDGRIGMHKTFSEYIAQVDKFEMKVINGLGVPGAVLVDEKCDDLVKEYEEHPEKFETRIVGGLRIPVSGNSYL